MIQDLYQKAMKFAAVKHWQQQVPGSRANYVLHLSNVAMEIFVAYLQKQDFDLDFALQVAALHDVLEDTDTSYEELLQQFGEKIATAVQALSKNPAIASKRDQMMDSLSRINLLEKEVAMVKIADRITNLQPPPDSWTLDKRREYLNEAYLIAGYLATKHSYLIFRLFSQIEVYEKNILEDSVPGRNTEGF